MAKVTSIPDSSCIFMGNPIVYTVTPGVVNAADVAFHRVKMLLTISGHDFELSQPVDDSASTIDFDISSCFRSAANLYDYAPVTTSEVRYPLFTTTRFRVEDEWVEGGVVKTGGVATVDARSAIMGAYSDYERRRDTLTPTLSRKPASGEIAFCDDDVVYAVMDGMVPCSRIEHIPENASGLYRVNGRALYVVPTQRQSMLFQFVNTRGCIETIRAWGVGTEKMKSSATSVTLSRFERFNTFSRVYNTKQLKPTEIVMTSGVVDYEWAQWWAYEFCMATRYWMLYDGQWVPCNVTIDENATIIDHTKQELNFVQFTVSPDVNGPLW